MNETLINTQDSLKNRVKAIIGNVLSQKYSMVLWRLPLSTKVYLLIDKGDYVEGRPNFEKPGFSFGRFDNNELKDSVYLNQDNLVVFDLRTGEIDGDDYFEGSENFDWHYVQTKGDSTSHGEYVSNVNQGIKRIAEADFRKVVVARQLVDQKNKKLNLVDVFFETSEKYTNAFCSLLSIDGIGTWLTASPEILVSVSEQNVFKTVALAGTQRRTVDNLKEALWRQKEIEEQSLVSKYIINCFKQIRVREYDDIGPKTVTAGDLLHLRTDFYVDMDEVNYPHLPETMMNLLHPTSAVCGMPKEESKEFILKNEGFDRGYFSGFLGPINIGGETHQFVNLRCAQITEDKIIYYAGAGITEDSDPEKEWLETEMKVNILRSVFSQA